MKTATIVLAFLVAVLLWAPAPVSAADSLPFKQAHQPLVWEQETEGDSATPTEAPTEAPTEEGTDSSGIVDLHATAGRLRGRVELSWSVNDQANEGVFVVERSTNGSSWRPVKACSQHYDPDQADYSCTDTRLTSGTTYAYRVCLAAKGTTCSSASPSQPVTLKAP